MAIKPVVTAGLAVASAAAVVAATPALMPQGNEVQVPAAVAAAPAMNQMTVNDLRLMALSDITLNRLINVALGTPGYGGVVTGDPTTPDGSCTGDDAVCFKGWVGVPYYILDQALPSDILVDNTFFESGVVPIIGTTAVTVASIIDANDPTGRLDLAQRVSDFFEGGAFLVLQDLIDDNLPDGPVGEYAKGLNDAFFDGGVVAVVAYVVNTPLPTAVEEESSSLRLVSNSEETETPAKEEKSGPVAKLLGKSLVQESTPEVVEEDTDGGVAQKVADKVGVDTGAVKDAAPKPVKNLQNVLKDNPLANILKPAGSDSELILTGKSGGQDYAGKRFVKNIANALNPKKEDKKADSSDGGDSE